MRTRKPLALSLVGGLVAAFAAVVVAAPPASADTVVPASFGYTGGEQVWNVPPNVSSVRITTIGARGGDGGASGSSGWIALRTTIRPMIPMPAHRLTCSQRRSRRAGRWTRCTRASAIAWTDP